MRPENSIDFAGCAANVEGLGPGKRVALWVRGCSLACPGCMTTELWPSNPPAKFKRIEYVAELLMPLLQDADGLTISGGEPMEQPAGLSNLVALLRKSFPDLEVLVYSGHPIEELILEGSATQRFLQEIDILIDRPFERDSPHTLKWRGSDNQRVFYLTERAQKYTNLSDAAPEKRPLQIQMLGNGQFRIIGIPDRGDMEKYRQLLNNRGIKVRKASVQLSE